MATVYEIERVFVGSFLAVALSSRQCCTQVAVILQDYSGVKAPVRKKVNEVSSEAFARYMKGDKTAIPHWMQIREGDTEKQREKKVRAIKAFKKKMRCFLLISSTSFLPPLGSPI